MLAMATGQGDQQECRSTRTAKLTRKTLAGARGTTYSTMRAADLVMGGHYSSSDVWADSEIRWEGITSRRVSAS